MFRSSGIMDGVLKAQLSLEDDLVPGIVGSEDFWRYWKYNNFCSINTKRLASDRYMMSTSVKSN